MNKLAVLEGLLFVVGDEGSFISLSKLNEILFFEFGLLSEVSSFLPVI